MAYRHRPGPRRLLICGGRDFDDRPLLETWLALFRAGYGEFELIVGYDPRNPKFQGADQIAYEWAKAHQIRGQCFPALWDVHGRAAGPIRNQKMLERGRPDHVGHTIGGDGTADMVRRAERARVDLIPIRAIAARPRKEPPK